MISLATSQAQIEQITRAIAKAPWVGLDLEFASSDRYWPELCLIQLALGGHHSWDAACAQIVASESAPVARGGKALEQTLILIDALPLGLPSLVQNKQPMSGERQALIALVKALASHPRLLTHSPRQDLAILTANSGVHFAKLFDTQVAGAFCGYGDQVGYSRLVEHVFGQSLSKEQQWTNWRKRPLAPEQLGYARDDVRYLFGLEQHLRAKLGERIDWVEEEIALVIDAAMNAATIAPRNAWRQQSMPRGMNPHIATFWLATLEWRMAIAQSHNRPLSHVLEDGAVFEFARRCAAFRGERRLDEFLDEEMTKAKVAGHYREQLKHTLAERMAERAPLPVELLASMDTVPAPDRKPATGRVSKWSDQLLLIAAVCSEESGVAARYLATRSDADSFARKADSAVSLADVAAATAEHPAQASWRKQLLGLRWLQWFRGEGSLVADEQNPIGMRWQLLAPAVAKKTTTSQPKRKSATRTSDRDGRGRATSTAGRKKKARST